MRKVDGARMEPSSGSSCCFSGKMVEKEEEELLVDDFAGINTEGQKMLDILSWVCSVASDSFLMKRRAT